jgi:hypothetical protein
MGIECAISPPLQNTEVGSERSISTIDAISLRYPNPSIGHQEERLDRMDNAIILGCEGNIIISAWSLEQWGLRLCDDSVIFAAT